MNTRILNRSRATITLLAAVLLAGTPAALAQTPYTWIESATGSEPWTDATNWDATNGQFVSGAANELLFYPDVSALPNNGAQTITSFPSALSMNTLTLNGRSPNNINGYTIMFDSASTWTIGDGTASTINLNANQHSFDFRSVFYELPDIVLNQAVTTITGNGTSAGFHFMGNITEAAAGYGITKSGNSRAFFFGTNTYTGTTEVNGGILRLSSAGALPGGIGVSGGTSALTLNGGVMELAADDFLRNLGTGSDQFQIIGGASGFSAKGAHRYVSVNNDPSQEIVWGSATFDPSTLVLNESWLQRESDKCDNDLTLLNKIDLGGTTRTVEVNAHTAFMPGVVQTSSSTAGLTKTGNGRLFLSGANTYNGDTTISDGTLSIETSDNAGVGGGIIFNGGNLEIRGTALTQLSGLGHAVTLNSNKTVGLDIVDASNTFTADIALTQGNGGLIKRGSGTLVLDQANTFTGATTVSGGGNLILDYSSEDNSKLSDTNKITLGESVNPDDAVNYVTRGGTTITLSGGSHSETVSSTTLTDNTATTITRSSGTSTINLNAISKGKRSVLSLSEDGIATTDKLNRSSGITGILGAWATVGSHWAVNSTNGPDGPITAYSSYTPLPTSTFDATTNYELQGSQTLAGGGTLGTLRIENTGDDQELDIGGSTVRIVSFTNGEGGILYAGGANNNYTITGTGDLEPSNGNGQSLLINTYTGKLTVNADLDYGSSGLTKAGEGILAIGGASKFSGIADVQQGTLLINGDSTQMNGTLTVQPGATLGGTGILGGNTVIAKGGMLEFDLSTAPGSHDKLDTDGTGRAFTFSGDSTLTITSSGGSTTGTYTLLTADGGIVGSAPETVNLPAGWTADAPVIVGNDLQINITSVGGGASPYDTWAAENGLTPGVNDGQADNPDNDSWNNELEFGFGFDPLTGDGGDDLEVDNPGPSGTITQLGGPTIWFNGSGVPHLRYTRRADAATAGLGYVEEFSFNMNPATDEFEPTGNTAVPIGTGTGAGDGGEAIEAWQVPLDEILPVSGRKARFGRVEVTYTP